MRFRGQPQPVQDPGLGARLSDLGQGQIVGRWGD